MDVSAIVLSSKPYDRRFAGVKVHEHISRIETPQQLQAARFEALTNVDTEWSFFLDDDDDLPINHEEIIALCTNAAISENAVLAYTNELVKTESRQYVRQSFPYTQDLHLKQPLLVHHMSVFKTEAALDAIKAIPRGRYCPEMPLYFQLAKRGAVHVPAIGYIWNKRQGGMHSWALTQMSWGNALAWCSHNRG